MALRYPAAELIGFAQRLLAGVGLEADLARTTAEILVEGDLLGHTTHGLALLAAYLKEAESGAMARSGAPKVLADHPAALTWDGARLPGPWLVSRGIEEATQRASRLGTASVVIRHAHHIACLAAYLRRPAERGKLTLIACSDPAVAGVAPFGGRKPLLTPNPIAASWPTDQGPVILDVSQSITSMGLARRLKAEGRRLPGLWGLDAAGHPTDDPGAIYTEPPGSLLPTGGLDHGHKGFALALLVEALTCALAGEGRADGPTGWTAMVFIQVFDPALYGGTPPFVREASWLADACRNNPARPGVDRVRLPGERGLALREEQLVKGVALYPSILATLQPWSEKLSVPMPPPCPNQ